MICPKCEEPLKKDAGFSIISNGEKGQKFYTYSCGNKECDNHKNENRFHETHDGKPISTNLLAQTFSDLKRLNIKTIPYRPRRARYM